VWKILSLNGWSMTTASPLHWASQVTGSTSKDQRQACRLFVGDVLLRLLFAFSLPRSEPAHAIAEDALYVPLGGSRHSHR
jgi:hypothetical protein